MKTCDREEINKGIVIQVYSRQRTQMRGLILRRGRRERGRHGAKKALCVRVKEFLQSSVFGER